MLFTPLLGTGEAAARIDVSSYGPSSSKKVTRAGKELRSV